MWRDQVELGPVDARQRQTGLAVPADLGPVDWQLAEVRGIFTAAWDRQREAEARGAAGAELSNMLGQLYRLHELAERRLGVDAFRAMLVTTPDLRAARGAVWARTFDVHEVARVSTPGDYFGTSSETVRLGNLVWLPLPDLADKYDRHKDYARELAGRTVLDTILRAFDAVAGLAGIDPRPSTPDPSQPTRARTTPQPYVQVH